MPLESWLPIGHKLPDGERTRHVVFEGSDWQIVDLQGGGRALVADDSLMHQWLAAGLIEPGQLKKFAFGSRVLHALTCGPSQVLCPVAEGESPNTKPEAMAFAQALRSTRTLDKSTPLQDAIYAERLSRLLPTYSVSPRVEDDVVLGYWLTGGATVSATSFRRMRQMLSWMGTPNLRAVVEAAGMTMSDHASSAPQRENSMEGSDKDSSQGGESVADAEFELPGRPELANFFNEHVVDIVRHRDRYRALGIEFPSAVVLHGPPGCGKTFAVERLIDYLGWPSFDIDAGSVASPFIHDTSKKVAEVFEKAKQSAPSVLVIDEMEAFLADREMGAGSSHHRVEEVAEFLRQIPDAVKNDVLIIAMTNRVEMIDPAILRRGRFDHVVKVDFASEEEVAALLGKLLASLPGGAGISVRPLAKVLAGRPLSDVTFVVREGARLAARAGKSALDADSLQAALNSAPAREREGGSAPARRIGFV